MALMAAATHPERVDVTRPRQRLRAVRPGRRLSRRDCRITCTSRTWRRSNGSGALASCPRPGPSVVDRPGVVDWWARVERFGATPAVARASSRRFSTLDVRDVLPLVDVPTLVIHSRDNVFVRVGHGRYLAEHIAGARSSSATAPTTGRCPSRICSARSRSSSPGRRSGADDCDRVLATVLFVDVVGSTEFAADSATGAGGSRSTGSSARAHALAAVRRELEDTAGDGMLATFDGPARAIRCASDIRDEATPQRPRGPLRAPRRRGHAARRRRRRDRRAHRRAGLRAGRAG